MEIGSEAHKGRQRAGFAAACVICCGLPMLVAVGVLTATGAAVGGLAGAAATVAVFFAGRLAFRRRREWGVITALCGLAGGVLAIAGLSELVGDRAGGRGLVSGGIAALAVGALAALAPTGEDRPAVR